MLAATRFRRLGSAALYPAGNFNREHVLTRRDVLLSGTALGVMAAPAIAARVFFSDPGPDIGQEGLGEDARTLRDRVNVFDFMTPDEIADVRSNRARVDVTLACQSALRTGRQAIFPAGTYLVNAAPESCLRPASNQTITLEAGAVLQARSNSLDLYSVLRLEGVENVIIEGGTIRGERATHRGSSGEHGMGIAVYDSRRITIRNLSCRDCWGDGIYVGGRGLTGRSEDVVIESCTCENNRRQGLTIAAVDRCKVTRGKFCRTGGIAPAAGIDIEPNHAVVAGIAATKGGVSNVVIEGVECSENEGAGITVSQVHTSNVKISQVVAHRNGESGIICGYVGKNVEIIDPDCQENGWHGINVVGDKAYVTKNISLVRPICRGNRQDGIFFGLNVDGFSVVGGTVSHNGQNGILCDGAGGSVCDNGRIQGVSIHSNSQSANAAFDNIRIGSLCHQLRIQDNVCKAGAERNKPAFGISIRSDEPMLIARNDLRSGGVVGNARGAANKVVWIDNYGVSVDANAG